ncbi:hypothetical protein KSP40_PGU015091 [Platanthera guangdongensis]|uniref:Uroporphyrinogen-III synthase n=1 Tax=Platanthera guangdongensis TaxID=2320717 RepID=A0ABR2MPZ6_9ASPA
MVTQDTGVAEIVVDNIVLAADAEEVLDVVAGTELSDNWDKYVACIGQTTALAAKRLGLKNVYYPDNPGLEGWVDSILEALRMHGGDDKVLGKQISQSSKSFLKSVESCRRTVHIPAWVNLVQKSKNWDKSVACIGQTTALAAKRLGLKNVYYPDNPGLEGRSGRMISERFYGEACPRVGPALPGGLVQAFQTWAFFGTSPSRSRSESSKPYGGSLPLHALPLAAPVADPPRTSKKLLQPPLHLLQPLKNSFLGAALPLHSRSLLALPFSCR